MSCDLRLLTWNCNNGLAKEAQISYFKAFRPDIAIIPELKEANIPGLEPESFIWVTNNSNAKHPKGLGILAYNGFRLHELQRDEEMEIFVPLTVSRGEFSFNLLAIWNFYWACKQGRFKGLKGPNCLEYAALEHYKNLFVDPALIVGDWNLGPTFDQKDFLKILDIVAQYGVKSLYHEHYQIPPSETKHPTFRSSRKRLHHIDHVFGSKYFIENMNALRVDTFDNVVLSDHAPLLLEVYLSQHLVKKSAA